MAEYKNIPVDPETYEVVKHLAKINWRGLGAQVRALAEAEMKRMEAEAESGAEAERMLVERALAGQDNAPTSAGQ